MAFKLMKLWVHKGTDNIRASSENHRDIYNDIYDCLQ